MRGLLVVTGLLAGCGASTPRREAEEPIQRPERAARAHDADDEIHLQGELGVLDQDQIDAGFRPRLAAINGCYQDAVGKLWYLGGRLELKVRVLPDGATKEVTTVAPLGNWAAERCILDVVRGLTFARPKGNAEAEFNYSWEFRGKAPMKEWGNDDVGANFAKRRPELVACEKKGPVPPGLRITFFVEPGGKVTSVGLGADAPLDESYARCVADRVAAWKFADPLGTIARATYQF